MEKRKVEIYDTTLRDGSQMNGINFSVEDKLRIVQKLDDIGIDYAECGWPGSNPKDEEFFKLIKMIKLSHIKISAFGSTRHPRYSVENDPNLKKIIEAQPDVSAIFGKAWDFHVEKALEISLEKNLEIIEDSIRYVKKEIKKVFFDAEHFFDGYKANPEYAIKVLKAAEKGGADILVLCDTNGGCLYSEIGKIIDEVKTKVHKPLAIHAHNDGGLGTANSIEAVNRGAIQVQGTINGYGERCGNANLCEVIPNLVLKMGISNLKERLGKLTRVSRFVSEISNMAHMENQPYVGGNAFAHKGGIHVSAVIKSPKTYEHIEPEKVGNKRTVLVSDLAGRSNIVLKAQELGIGLDKDDKVVKDVVAKIKDLENQGYEFEGADGSFELLLKKAMRTRKYFFDLKSFRLIIERTEMDKLVAEATVKMQVDGNKSITHTVSEGDGPVNALDAALRKALLPDYPQIDNIELVDYKVRVLNGKEGTAAKVRVLIETMDKNTNEKWGTVGVSENIIKASWEALIDSIEIYLHRH